MIRQALLYLGAALPLFWGIAHLLPTANVINGFGDITADNRRIITMEWIIEGVSLIFVGLIVATATFIDPESAVASGIYLVTFLFLNALSLISLKTGYRIDFLPFRLCPLIFTTASLLILTGTLL